MDSFLLIFTPLKMPGIQRDHHIHSFLSAAFLIELLAKLDPSVELKVL